MEKQDRERLVRIESAVNTIVNRGCTKGEEYSKELHERIDGQYRWIVGLGVVATGIASAISAAITYVATWMKT